jgi:Major Facilitator Superfamily
MLPTRPGVTTPNSAITGADAMTDRLAEVTTEVMQGLGQSPGAVLRSVVIGLTAFLTVVDLFATQAILPSLARHYQVAPAAMGFAVNATTMGMAVAGLVVGFFSPHIDRRLGILVSLTVLAIPTSLLASAPNLTIFTLLRIAQGLCMASAFALTLAYLGEQCSAMDAGGAFAAYITGNVASNLIGRLISAALADTFGLASNFYFFALLNLAGAALVYFTIQRVKPMHSMGPMQSPLAAMIEHWRNPRLRAAFGIGFCILFAFIGTFTNVNFVLVRAAVTRNDGPRICLFRLPALDFHHASRRPGGRPIWHEARDLGRTRARDVRLAADAVLAFERGRDRHGAGRRRHILRTGRSDRICRTGRAGKPRRGQRDLSRLLFCRRPGRQRRARSVVRPLLMD